MADGRLNDESNTNQRKACGAPVAVKAARRVREAVQGNRPVLRPETAPWTDFTAIDVNGQVQPAGEHLKVGVEFAQRKVTVRVDGHLAHIIDSSILVKTLPFAMPTDELAQIRGARIATGPLPTPAVGTVSVQRLVPPDGAVMVTRQRLKIGRTCSGQMATIYVECLLTAVKRSRILRCCAINRNCSAPSL